MANVRTSIHGQWSGRLAFILAATGSAVGLGNIWKFPYITGENGGGAFVLIYLVCIAVIGIPIMMAEVMLGRRGRQSPINTMRTLAADEGKSHYWVYLGWAGVIAGFLILSYYSVIAGWALAYVFRTSAGVFSGVTSDGAGSIFTAFISSPETLLAWHTIFMVMTMIVVARGVKSGLEQAVKFLMPALFVLLVIMVGYAMNTDSFSAGLDFLFKPDMERLFYLRDADGGYVLQADGSKIFTWNGVLVAMGHAFFTLSLGMGAIMVYGSYLPKNISIAKTSIVIACMDTIVALLAGMVIFPIVFANELAPGSGPGLIFVTLPIAFGHMPAGAIFGTIFFVLLVFAAWTSAISLIEPAVAWLVENRQLSRVHAAVLAGMVTWLLGIVSVFSFNIWSEFTPLSGIAIFEKSTLFDLLDYFTSNIMLPLGGLSIAIFAGWSMSRTSSCDEFNVRDGVLFRCWLFLVRYVTPVAVIVVFLNATGVIDWLGSLIQ